MHGTFGVVHYYEEIQLSKDANFYSVGLIKQCISKMLAYDFRTWIT
jgi:hypothetical protein